MIPPNYEEDLDESVYLLRCDQCGHEEHEPYADGDECPWCVGTLKEVSGAEA